MRILVLGAGFGGLELTTRLADEFGDDINVVLIDRSDGFVFGFSKLDVMFGRALPKSVHHTYRDLVKPGVTMVRSEIRSIDPATKHVETDAGGFDADILVIALGADLDPAATPGLLEGGYEFYTVSGAFALRDVLEGFDGGRVIVAVTSTPFKCPPAPSETALLMHDFLSARGSRERSEISLVMPLGVPIPPSPAASEALLAVFAERGIAWYPERMVRELDPARKVAVLSDGDELPYDLFLGVPTHRAPAVVEDSGLAVDGWIPVDPWTLETTFRGVYAIGDVASVGTPKAGVFAEGQAAVVADRIAALVRAAPPSARYDGHGMCYLEFGRDQVARVDVTFLSGERPVGDMEGPSQALAADKVEFGSSRIERWFGQAATGFEGPRDLAFNRGLIADPAAFARDANAASWLYLCGEEFAAMDGGMSYADVQAAVSESANVVSDPPRELDMELARRQVAALDSLPRPTLVTCRTGPRSSALVYLYAGLRAGASPDEVIARAEADGAPFAGSAELRAWVTEGLEELS
jgi:sulfide:quinone oxidoreductase